MITIDDEREFDVFVRASSGRLVRTAYLLTGDHGHAEDVVQTALLRTARRWRDARANPHAYARQVVVNLSRDRWRNRSRRPVEQPLVRDVPVAEEDAHHHALLAASAALPHGQRVVLVLRFFDGLSVEETATALGCSTGTVKSQTHRALANLRRALTTNQEFADAD